MCDTLDMRAAKRTTIPTVYPRMAIPWDHEQYVAFARECLRRAVPDDQSDESEGDKRLRRGVIRTSVTYSLEFMKTLPRDEIQSVLRRHVMRYTDQHISDLGRAALYGSAERRDGIFSGVVEQTGNLPRPGELWRFRYAPGRLLKVTFKSKNDARHLTSSVLEITSEVRIERVEYGNGKAGWLQRLAEEVAGIEGMAL